MTLGALLALGVVMTCLADAASAALVTLVSAQMGPTNQVGGHTISSTQWVGWRFQIASSIQVTEVGGHLRGGNGNLTAAILRLTALTALPQGAPFAEGEVVAHGSFAPPLPSDEVLVPLAATLAPGSYAVVFGAGQFETTGSGLIPNSGQPNIAPTVASSYIAWRQSLPGVFTWSTGSLNNLRFVVRGNEYGGPADFNLDGRVDAQDLSAWRDGFGTATAAAASLGNADGDGDVDGADFLAWQRALGTAPASAVLLAGVPEPSALLLAAAAIPWAPLILRSREPGSGRPGSLDQRATWLCC